MKTILSLLLLGCLTLAAQPQPGTPAPAVPTAVSPATNAPPTLPGLPPTPRRVRPQATNAPATSVPSLPAPQTPVPLPAGDPAAAAPPGVPAAAVNAPAIPPAANPAPANPVATATAPAAEEVAFKPKYFSYSGAELNQVLEQYGKIVSRNMLRAPAVETVLKNPVFFVNQTPLTLTEAIQAHQAIFALNGVALVEVDEKFLKVVPIAEAPGSAQKPILVTDTNQFPAELGQFVTYTLQLKYAKPSEMVQLLTTFQSGKIANAVWGIDATSTLVLRDFSENVKRMLELIERVDVGGISEFVSEVIPIKFAKAEEIAQALGSLSGSGSTTTVGTRSTGGSTGATGLGNRPGLGGFNPTTPGAINTPGTTSAGTPSAGSSFSSRINQIINNASRMSASGSGEFQIIGPNKIVADVRANSLIVFASKHDVETIKDIISKLDVVLAQVVIETLILDVGLDHAWNLGVQAGQRPKFVGGTNTAVGGMFNNGKNPLGTGISFLNQFSSVSNVVTPNTSFAYPDAGGFNYFAKMASGGLAWDVMVQAAASDSTVNVIQKPRIQTSHAKAARIFIGGTVPYVQSTYYGGSYLGGPSSSYQQLPVGIGLQVTPFINADGLVVLQIDDFSIDEISGSTDITGVGAVPNTTKRQLLGEIAVRDGETIMLGGFVRNSETKSKSGVPLLKDIPLLGNLFSSRGTTKERKELIVLMRPTVLRTPEVASAQVEKEKKTMPGIMRAEQDMLQSEQEALDQARRDVQKAKREQFKKTTPFTEEEKKLYGNP